MRAGRYLMVLLLFLLKTAHSQTALEWLDKCSSTLEGTATLSVNISMELVVGNDNEVLEASSGIYMQSPQGVYSELGTVTSIKNKSMLLVLDKSTSTILVGKNNTPQAKFDFAKIYTELKPYIDSIYIDRNESSLITIVCKYKPLLAVPYIKAEFNIDKATGMPAKLQLFLRQGMFTDNPKANGKHTKIVFEYANWQLNNPIDSEKFNINKYVEIKDGIWVGVNSFKTFEITELN